MHVHIYLHLTNTHIHTYIYIYVYIYIYIGYIKFHQNPPVSPMPGASSRIMVKKQQGGRALSKRGVMTSQFRKGQPCLVWQKLLWFTGINSGRSLYGSYSIWNCSCVPIYTWWCVAFYDGRARPKHLTLIGFPRYCGIFFGGFVASEQWLPTSTSSRDLLCTTVFPRWFRHVLHKSPGLEQPLKLLFHFGGHKVSKWSMLENTYKGMIFKYFLASFSLRNTKREREIWEREIYIYIGT